MADTLPSAHEMFQNLKDSAKSVMSAYGDTGKIFSCDDVIERRMKICDSCEHKMLTASMPRCSLCGCNLVVKTKLGATSCPIKKWDIDPEFLKK